MTWTELGGVVVAALVCAIVGFALGDGYIARLPHHEGYFLVSVDDEVRAPVPPRPRHTAVIVVDGLRRDFAETMEAVRRLRERGQCLVSRQGPYTVSRPLYSTISTGVEVARHGSRNNESTAPLAAESVWQVARKAGLRVTGAGHMRWFAELFPTGFDRFEAGPHPVDVFALAELADLTVYDPVYVDETAHQRGAASPDYARAVERADRETLGLLEKLDLTTDLVVFTADHGHVDKGGHGCAEPEVAEVLTCFAGRNVRHDPSLGTMDVRATAAAIATLIGVRLPRHTFAGAPGEDGLDVLERIVDAHDAYRSDRRAAVARFRAANEAQTGAWLGRATGSWTTFYAAETAKKNARVALFAVLLFAALAVGYRRRRLPPPEIATSVVWLALSLATFFALHALVLGSFDFTAINLRVRFLPRAFGVSVAASVVSLVAHRVAFDDPRRLLADGTTLLVGAFAVDVAQLVVYGAPLGFPLPPKAMLYVPFIVSIFVVSLAVVLLVWTAGIAFAQRARRSR